MKKNKIISCQKIFEQKTKENKKTYLKHISSDFMGLF